LYRQPAAYNGLGLKNNLGATINAGIRVSTGSTGTIIKRGYVFTALLQKTASIPGLSLQDFFYPASYESAENVKTRGIRMEKEFGKTRRLL
jgi:hypothetical protein